MKHSVTLFLSMVSLLTSSGQNLEQRFKKTFEANRVKAEQIATKQNIRLRQVSRATGTVSEFAGFSANGQMLFNKTYNIGAGRTISTNKVWPGGPTGTFLTGSGMTNQLGEWDGGAIKTSHPEFGGRATQVDGATEIIDHATHVAGTLIAAGIQENAKGMAYQAHLRAYQWDNDKSEMAAAAAAGMLVSNHSYGTVGGWNKNEVLNRWEWWGDRAINLTQDYKFGFYNQEAAEWDEIAFNNPYYLICKSAGNERTDNPTEGTWYMRNGNDWIEGTGTKPLADGPYDCITTHGTAKNILTVGAVNKINHSNNNNGWTQASDVIMSDFSAWGPTDDGRIKPDVVACGVEVYSTFSSSDYKNSSGTSMATPNAAGSLLLVQQHYHNLRGRYMRSASLKGLIIHTTDEAGPATGPDYSYGWGLINIAKAVATITDSSYNQIQERTLADHATYTQGISSDGLTPLKVTICWTERQGIPPLESVNPNNRMLVNDLDIRIRRNSDNTLFYPYILNPAIPSAGATTGDNNRDNVEQILVAAPEPGAYTVIVSHKGTLANAQAQDYSLIISGYAGDISASFTANMLSICSGKTVSFTDQSGGNPTSRTWYFPGGIPATSTAANVDVTYTDPGQYTVALKVANPLGSDSIYMLNYIKVGGLSLPFTETFENASSTLSSWTIDNPNNDTTWRLADVGGTTPGNQAYCLPFYSYPNNTKGYRDGLISPPFNFTGLDQVSLSFTHAYSGFPDFPTDSLIILVSDNCGNTWTRIASYGENGTSNFATSKPTNLEFVPLQANNWCASNCITLDLSAYKGINSVKIKFETYNSFGGNNLYLDNIHVNGTFLQPVARFGIMQTTVCAGQPVLFIDSSDNNPASWEWELPGSNFPVASLQNPFVVYTVPGTYSVKLKVSNPGGSDSITLPDYITVIESPNKPNISTNDNTGICIGDSVSLMTDSINSGFQWYRNSTSISGAAANHFSAKTSGDYKVNIYGPNGCPASSDIINVLAGTKPDIPAITTNIAENSFCREEGVILTSSAPSGNQWYRNGNSISGAIDKTYNTHDSGTYSVISMPSGCPSDPSPEITLGLKPEPTTSDINGPASTHYRAVETYSVTSNAGSSYQWTVTNGNVTNGNGTATVNITWDVLGSGVVSVTETGSNGCKGASKTLDISLTPPVGLQQLTFFSGISFYPNPVHDQLNIMFNGTAVQKEVAVKLINMIGQVITEHKLPAVYNGDIQKLDLTKFSAGIYFVEISTSEGSKQAKIIKR